MNKTDVLICDDQQKFIDEFKKNHFKHYDICEVNDVNKLITKIKEKKPNIVLLDLYHPKDSNSDFDTRKLKAEQELKNLDKQIETTKQAVNNVWEPIGLDILKDIRAKYSSKELPVLIYSQRGLILMGDEQLQQVEKNKGHWMLKKVYSPNTEKIRIDRIVEEASNMNPLAMTYKKMFIFTIVVSISFISFILLKFDKTIELVFSAIFSGIIAFISTIASTKYVEK